jgi:ATP-dependent Lhr-like helicase
MRGRLGTAAMESAGRWSLLPWAAPRLRTPEDGAPARRAHGLAPGLAGEAAEAFALGLLRRYGVVFRRLLERERLAPPWHVLLRAYRLLEARGDVRGGRFVAAVTGEQYALPEAVAVLRDLRRRPAQGRVWTLCAADPLNLVGILTPGARVAATAANRVVLRDGFPLAGQEGGELTPLATLDEAALRACRIALAQHGSDHLPRAFGWGG